MPLTLPPISPSEILMVILNAEIDTAICPSRAVVGPASDPMQQAGVVQLTDAGATKVEKYVNLHWDRVQIRCLHSTLGGADRIGYHVHDILFDRGRQVVTTPSTGQKWLVHQINPSTSPSQHWDSPEDWEVLSFVEVVIGGCPVP